MKAYTVSLTKNYLDDSTEEKTYNFRIEFNKLIFFAENKVSFEEYLKMTKENLDEFTENVEIIINKFKEQLTDQTTFIYKSNKNDEIILTFQAILNDVEDFTNFLSELENLKKELLLNKSIYIKIENYV